MPMKFVTLRVWHPDCWMLELCEHHRDVTVESRGVCAHGDTIHADAVVRSAHHDAVRVALDDRVPSDVNREILDIGHGYAEVYSNYPTYRSVYDTTLSTGFLVVGPIVHHDGYERWDVLADASKLHEGVARLREVADVRVERVSETKPPPGPPEGLMGSLADELSSRQFDILRRAVNAGYYEWPRGKNVKRLAAELGISGPTCLEHIRRAESRIVPAVVEELAKLRGRSAGPSDE